MTKRNNNNNNIIISIAVAKKADRTAYDIGYNSYRTEPIIYNCTICLAKLTHHPKNVRADINNKSKRTLLLLSNLADTENTIKTNTNKRYNEYSERRQGLQHSHTL